MDLVAMSKGDLERYTVMRKLPLIEYMRQCGLCAQALARIGALLC